MRPQQMWVGIQTMGNRLSKIVTKTGDNGTSGLGDGSRRDKSDIIFDAIGDVDELNCHIGIIVSEVGWGIQNIRQIQNQLFDIGGELSMPDCNIIDLSDVEMLEKMIEQLNQSLPPLKNFILPGGSTISSSIHLARAVCRRAERTLCKASMVYDVNQFTLQYINRLSDLLFVLSRRYNQLCMHDEILWQPKEKPNV